MGRISSGSRQDKDLDTEQQLPVSPPTMDTRYMTRAARILSLSLEKSQNSNITGVLICIVDEEYPLSNYDLQIQLYSLSVANLQNRLVYLITITKYINN